MKEFAGLERPITPTLPKLSPLGVSAREWTAPHFAGPAGAFEEGAAEKLAGKLSSSLTALAS
jgi:hypothetical protein